MVELERTMVPQPRVSPDLPISRFVEEFVYRFHHREFPVTRDGILMGTIGKLPRSIAGVGRTPRSPRAWSAVRLPPRLRRRRRCSMRSPKCQRAAAAGFSSCATVACSESCPTAT
jgi:hypothetical protein